jgi:hypothetical protein
MLTPISKLKKKVPDGNFNRLGDAQQGFNGDNFFSTFNLADIFGVQIHRFGQLLLSETSFFTIQPNGITNDFSMPKNRLFLRVRHALKNAETSLWLTPATCWYFTLAFLFAVVKVPNIVTGV